MTEHTDELLLAMAAAMTTGFGTILTVLHLMQRRQNANQRELLHKLENMEMNLQESYDILAAKVTEFETKVDNQSDVISAQADVISAHGDILTQVRADVVALNQRIADLIASGDTAGVQTGMANLADSFAAHQAKIDDAVAKSTAAVAKLTASDPAPAPTPAPTPDPVVPDAAVV